jgi:hypothetical protein
MVKILMRRGRIDITLVSPSSRFFVGIIGDQLHQRRSVKIVGLAPMCVVHTESFPGLS